VRQRPAGRQVGGADPGDDREPAAGRLRDHRQHPATLLGTKRADLPRDRPYQHAAATRLGAVIDQPRQARLVEPIGCAKWGVQARYDAAQLASRVDSDHPSRPSPADRGPWSAIMPRNAVAR
jgi:hypothetical protein